MMLFSYHGGIPSLLPNGLADLELSKLKELGYSGPFPAPVFNPRTQQAIWNGVTWQIIDLTEEQIQKAEYNRLLSRADWQGFSEAIMQSSAYVKARAAAAISLPANVDCTELIALLADARAGRPYIESINANFISIEAATNLDEKDKAQMYQLIQDYGLGCFLTVPNYNPPSLEKREIE